MNANNIISSAYNAYNNFSLTPASLLNAKVSISAMDASVASSVARAQRPELNAAQVAHARGKQFAASAAKLPIYAFKPIELFVGTGHNTQGLIDVSTAEGRAAHAKNLLRAPTNTGLCGLSQGLAIASSLALGGALGAAVGFVGAAINASLGNFLQVRSAKEDIIVPTANIGAVLGCLMLNAGPLAMSAFLLGFLRTIMAMVKAVIAGVVAGVGYVGGFCFGAVESAVNVQAPLLPQHQ